MKWRILGTVIFLGASTAPCHAGSEETASQVNPLMMLPFLLLLLSIAILPFVSRHWWERYYPALSLGLGAITVSYYFFFLENPERLVHTAMEYVTFIALIGSLFVISGGIHIRIRGRSKPAANVFLLAIGGIVSNVLGTTGASMILIRPYLRVNAYRLKPFHIVFFIFIVSNMGGALTPIGDPPLFLGYLKGVPFFWVAGALWLPWLVGISLVLGIFYFIDLRAFRKLPKAIRDSAVESQEEGEVRGLQNIFFLALVLVSVFIADPPFVREALMILAAIGSYFTTHQEIHKKNEFNFLPVKEVALLFLGIFATMIPALDWLQLNAGALGVSTAGQFFWMTGTLSSALDNAPTYLTFYSAATGLFAPPESINDIVRLIQSHGTNVMTFSSQFSDEVQNTLGMLVKYRYDDILRKVVSSEEVTAAYLMGNYPRHLEAISLASVFFGACTYIGNGPNFMVKSIAEHSGHRCAGFFSYLVGFAVPVLVPVFIVVWVFWFHS